MIFLLFLDSIKCELNISIPPTWQSGMVSAGGTRAPNTCSTQSAAAMSRSAVHKNPLYLDNSFIYRKCQRQRYHLSFSFLFVILLHSLLIIFMSNGNGTFMNFHAIYGRWLKTQTTAISQAINYSSTIAIIVDALSRIKWCVFESSFTQCFRLDSRWKFSCFELKSQQ